MRKFSVVLGLLAGIALTLQTPRNGVGEAVAMSMVDAEDCIRCLKTDCPDGWHDAWVPLLFPPNYTRNGGVHLSKRCFVGTCDVIPGSCNAARIWPFCA